MAGRTLFEVATGRVPLPGEPVDVKVLQDSRVSPPVADTIDGLCSGSFSDVRQALKYLHKRATKRIPSRYSPPSAAAPPVPAARAASAHAAAAAPSPAPALAALALADPPAPRPAAATPAATPAPAARAADAILPAPRPRPWWRRLLGI
jgi:hypothetical protein